ncbi:MAG: hypothetical protein H6920_09840 [Sphingomonadaceae bacterium]|nr:hypothetical protein [Novosphingobium sp.]MCP5391906.1 hypothetical protein [Sphingomonadaceae bacterium]
MSRPDHLIALSETDKVAAFKVATASFARKLGEGDPAPMTDDQIAAALRDTMGIFAGCAAPGRLHITWQGAGLKIWASWHIHNHVIEDPIIQGAATVAMARTHYRIPDPANRQMSLF